MTVIYLKKIYNKLDIINNGKTKIQKKIKISNNYSLE